MVLESVQCTWSGNQALRVSQGTPARSNVTNLGLIHIL